MKNKIKQFIYILIVIAIVSIFVYHVITNYNTQVNYICPLNKNTYTLSISIIISAFGLMSFICGYITNALFKQKLLDKCSAYEKRHENISIENESDKAKISTLEAKIATLEAALRSALDK